MLRPALATLRHRIDAIVGFAALVAVALASEAGKRWS
jgi:hypothetical protein